MDEYKRKDIDKPENWLSQTNTEDALKGGPPGSKIEVGVAETGVKTKTPDVRWKDPDGTTVAGREVKILEGDSLSNQSSKAKNQLSEVQANVSSGSSCRTAVDSPRRTCRK